jgi:probable HAF family extracellular repeat protein
MRARTAILTGLALSVLGCVSDPTSVSEDPSLARATTREYTPVHLSTLGDWPAGRAYGINAAGQIVGTTAGHAALWDKGVLKDLGDWGNEHSVGTTATAINNRGQVVGYSYEDYGEGETYEAFLWYKGTLTNLGFDVPSDINERGQVVGYGPGGGPGFLWENGVRTDLDIGGYAINNAGQIAGQTGQGHAAIWDKGKIIDLGTLGHDPGSFDLSGALDINDHGQVVGFTSLTGGQGYTHAFLWEKGRMTDLGTLGGRWSEARAINNAGQIVGYSNTSEQYGVHAFLWDKGVMVDLGTLGGPVAEALGINEKGDIVGATGIYEGAPDQPTLWTRKAKVK